MFYIENENKIVLFDEDKQKLKDTIAFMPQYEGLEIKEVEEGYVIPKVVFKDEKNTHPSAGAV